MAYKHSAKRQTKIIKTIVTYEIMRSEYEMTRKQETNKQTNKKTDK